MRCFAAALAGLERGVVGFRFRLKAEGLPPHAGTGTSRGGSRSTGRQTVPFTKLERQPWRFCFSRKAEVTAAATPWVHCVPL
jgi:hypothetical protein